MIEDDIKRRLEYNPETGDIIWKKIEENNRFDKRLNTKYAGKEAGVVISRGYKQINLRGKSLLSHRVAWFLYYGRWPENYIDHVNRNKSDNRIKNLRDVTSTVNSRNLPKARNNTSGVTGVYFHKSYRKWCAAIRVGGILINLGSFETIEEAKAARLDAEVKYGFHITHGKD